MTNINRINFKWLAIVLLAAFCNSCNPANKLAKEQTKSLNIVVTNDSLLSAAYNVWAINHPQIIQKTKTITTPGAPILIKIPVRDTIYERHLIDSLTSDKKNCGEAAAKAYDLGYEFAEKKYLKQIADNPCPSSTHTIEKDISEVTRCQNDLINARILNGKQQGTIEAQKSQLSDQSSRITSLWWILIGITAGLFAVIVLLVYLLIKKKTGL